MKKPSVRLSPHSLMKDKKTLLFPQRPKFTLDEKEVKIRVVVEWYNVLEQVYSRILN